MVTKLCSFYCIVFLNCVYLKYNCYINGSRNLKVKEKNEICQYNYFRTFCQDFLNQSDELHYLKNIVLTPEVILESVHLISFRPWSFENTGKRPTE